MSKKRVKAPPPFSGECADEGPTKFVKLGENIKSCPGIRIVRGKTELPAPGGVVEYSPETCQPPRSMMGNLCHSGGRRLYKKPRLSKLKEEFLGSFGDDEDILDEAARITRGARPEKYGPPKENHSRTATYWSTYLGIKLSARQVCMMNILQKISRDGHSPERDNLVDIAGWAQNADNLE